MKTTLKFLTALSIPLILTPPSSVIAEAASVQRLDEVEQRGKQVMPFKLDRTLHVFNKTDFGGIQKILVKKPGDIQQLKSARQHLQEIAVQFQQGNYTSATKIHGANMPGLAALKKAQTKQIKIEYQQLKNGAQISYASHQPGLIHAIHQWFDAQLTDHARHAVSEHPHHRMHQ